VSSFAPRRRRYTLYAWIWADLGWSVTKRISVSSLRPVETIICADALI
jgi:hypothetical protein